MIPQQTQDQGTQIDPFLVGAITASIAGTENGGKPNLSNPSEGQSGEMKSIYQYTPGTWKSAAKQFLGSSDAPLNSDTETFVTMQRVNKWLQQGYNPQQIFSMWNAGPGEPNAYEGKFSNGESATGMNKYGVKYNVPKYVDTAMNYLNSFMKRKGEIAPGGTFPQNGTPQQQPKITGGIASLAGRGPKQRGSTPVGPIVSLAGPKSRGVASPGVQPL